MNTTDNETDRVLYIQRNGTVFIGKAQAPPPGVAAAQL